LPFLVLSKRIFPFTFSFIIAQHVQNCKNEITFYVIFVHIVHSNRAFYSNLHKLCNNAQNVSETFVKIAT